VRGERLLQPGSPLINTNTRPGPVLVPALGLDGCYRFYLSASLARPPVGCCCCCCSSICWLQLLIHPRHSLTHSHSHTHTPTAQLSLVFCVSPPPLPEVQSAERSTGVLFEAVQQCGIEAVSE
jgi:hypothetical protein